MNNKKVTDHHAIIPTRELQKCNLSELPQGELAILQLISNRLCVAVGDPHRYAETVIELDCGGTAFSAKGKTMDCRPVQSAGNRPGTAAAISQPCKSADEVFERSERKEPEVFAALATTAHSR